MGSRGSMGFLAGSVVDIDWGRGSSTGQMKSDDKLPGSSFRKTARYTYRGLFVKRHEASNLDCLCFAAGPVDW